MTGRPKGSRNLAPYVRNDPLRRIEARTTRCGPIAAGMETSCWMWIGGSRNRDGYVQITLAGKRRTGAHRWAYELLVGPIPAGLTLDHLCRQPSCVNPEHLEPTTQRENNLRAPTSLTTINVAKTLCAHGHPYDEANTYHRPNGGRDCRKCICRRAMEYKRRKRAERSGVAA